MKDRPLSRFCVYAIVQVRRLARLAESTSPGPFTEKKSWVRAAELWERAQYNGHLMPVLFGDVADCTRLLFWGALNDLQV